MKEFLVSLFFEDTVKTEKISDFMRSRNDLLPEAAKKALADFSFPLRKTDGAYEIDLTGGPAGVQAFLNGEAVVRRRIAHGDYLFFRLREGEVPFSLLFVDCGKMKAGFSKYRLRKDTNIFIGRASDNDICFDLNDCVSRQKHAAIRIDASGQAFVEDLKRTVGVFVNGRRTNSAKLSPGDEIFLMGLTMVYMGEYLAVGDLSVSCGLEEYREFAVKTPEETDEREARDFVRSPRILKSLDQGVCEIDPPTTPQKSERIPAILAIGPSLTMAVAMLASLGFSIANLSAGGSMQSVASGGAMAVSMLLGAAMWPSLLNRYQKKTQAAQEKYRCEKYGEYLGRKDRELAAKCARNARIWNEVLSPGPDILCGFPDSPEKRLRLWERSAGDDDFLSVRVGLGDRDSGIDIHIPRDGFTLDGDELRELPKGIAEKYRVLKHVPITLPLREQVTVGLIGKRANIFRIANGIALNIAALHSWDEVKMVFVCWEKDGGEFEWARELPHVWSSDRSLRYLCTDPDEVHQVFSAVDELVKSREDGGENRGQALPHFVFFVADRSLIEGEALLRYLENPDNRVGISALFLYGDIATLPKDCRVIVQSDDAVCGYYSRNRNNNRFMEFEPDAVDAGKLRNFGKKLAALRVKTDSRNLGVPERISFLQMYRAGNIAALHIEKRWDGSSADRTLAAPVGAVAGGEIFSLDIHEAYHGCHGLVAGMTGSGKSEFLQAFILSLAVNYSPNEVAFVLVDFKGGDMARPFMEKEKTDRKPYVPSLPHLAATISNLSDSVLYRALVSLDAEIRTRQRVFNELAASLGTDKIDINSYQKYFKEGRIRAPLPHLVIVIDEFAQLKTQHPEFLEQLINIAQVGRSLGIHLILATQKPSGLVDPQIWSNSRFKVCLKVLDKQDSVEMIGRPDAAGIKLPGRCFVQVGYDEVFECVQSGYSGADYAPSPLYRLDDEITVRLVDHTATAVRSVRDGVSGEKTGRSQLEETVRELVALGQQKGLRAKPLWCAPLGGEILLDSLPDLPRAGGPSLSAKFALADYVRIQKQLPLEIDLLKSGHVAVYGASGSGKTTLLQTLVYSLAVRYTPNEVVFYVMDFGGRTLRYLELLPHCGGVVFSDSEDAVAEMLGTVQDIIEERKRLFAQENCGSYTEYLNAGGKKLPAVVLIVDNYAPFRERLFPLEERLIELVRSGRTYGVFAVITGSSKDAVYYRVTEHISVFLTLRMNDRMSYRDILNVPVPVEPEDIRGRGLAAADGGAVEFQTALAAPGDSEPERIRKISDVFSGLAQRWEGALPRPVRAGERDGADETARAAQNQVPAQAAPMPKPVSESPDVLIAGKSLSGGDAYGVELAHSRALFLGAVSLREKIPLFQFLLPQLSRRYGRRLVFIDDEREAFRELAQSVGPYRYISTAAAFGDFLPLLEDMAAKQKSGAGELSGRESREGGDAERLFLLIADFPAFYDMIADEDAERFTRIVKERGGSDFYPVTAAELGRLPPYNSLELYKYLIRADSGILAGGGIAAEHAGLLCDEMLDIAVARPPEAKDGRCLFYSHGKSVLVRCGERGKENGDGIRETLVYEQ